jgi:predicted PurR-regulated permease PerM
MLPVMSGLMDDHPDLGAPFTDRPGVADETPVPEGPRPAGLGVVTGLAIFVTAVVALDIARDVLIPIALAVLLSFILDPVVRLLRRAWLGRVPAVFLAVGLTLGTILALGGLIGSQATQLAADIPTYATTIDDKINTIRTEALGKVSLFIDTVTRQLQRFSALPPQTRQAPPANAGEPQQKPVPVELHQPSATPFQIAERVIAPVVPPLLTTAIVFVVTIFILLQQTDLRDRMIWLFGLRDMHRTTRALDDAARRLSRYLLTQLGLNALFGLTIGTGLLLIGLPNPLLWATLAALFRFVPYIGSVMAGLLPTALAAAVDPGWGMALGTVALFVVTEVVMGQFIDPLAYGRSTGLSPIAVVVAAIFWTWMWGPIGLLVSTPLTMCLVVLGQHIKRLEFLDVLMGDRPALTVVESFYQRILADDPDEVMEAAEAMLKDWSLAVYYDEVAIRALQLAAKDVERGVLNSGLVARIRGSMRRLIEDLGVVAETGGGTDKGSDTGDVLCIGGSGPLDQVVAEMLVQLLIRDGLRARAVPFVAASRQMIGQLEISEVTVVCACYLDIALSLSQLRVLVRRLRRITQATVVAGLWPGESEPAPDTGTDRYVRSLREAREVCAAAARDRAPFTGPLPRLMPSQT